jgi:hypothetical protein
MELRWEKPGEQIALRCRDPKRRDLEPPELLLDAPIQDGWVRGETLQNTSDTARKAQYTGDVDQYLGEVVKLPSHELFSTANLLAFDCMNVWAQWVKVAGPSCGIDNLKGATVTDSEDGKLVETAEAFSSEVMGRGSEAQERLITRYVMGADGWPLRIQQVHERDGTVVEEQVLERAVPAAATPTPLPTSAAPTDAVPVGDPAD